MHSRRSEDPNATIELAGNSARLQTPSRQQRQFAPLPVAIDICETDLTQPTQLGLEIKQFVRRIFRVYGVSDRMQKLFVQKWRGRGNMIQITENATRIQQAVGLRIERPLALVYQVMNGEARNNRIKPAKLGKRVIEIVFNYGNARIAGEALACLGEHRWREIDRDAFGGGPFSPGHFLPH